MKVYNFKRDFLETAKCDLSTFAKTCFISSNRAVLPGRNNAEISRANLLHFEAEYSEYDERFDLYIWV